MSLSQTSKFIALILRHKPEAIGITLDEHGWANVDELIKGIAKRQPFDIAMLEKIVATDEKQRYSFNEDKTLIRANQGHSIPVDVELEKKEPPAILYHGTGIKYKASIEEKGLIPKSRLYVHLSADKETALKVGQRHGTPIVYTINAAQMHKDGYKFYLSENGVWLTKSIPLKYLNKMKSEEQAMSFYFSKSKYTAAFQCPKILWLRENKPEEEEPLSEQEQEILDNGNVVGDLAMGIFGDYVEVTAHRADDPDRLDYAEMIHRTQEEMAKGTENICEASFSYDGLYCAVDILRRENGGWAIYEVKSATHRKDINIEDISYQKYVLEHCGVNVTGVYLVYINSEYVRQGELEINRLFVIEDVSADVNNEIQNVEPVLEQAKQTLSMLDEPEKALSADCYTPYACRFRNYCWRHLPEHSVFNLYRMKTADKINYYNSGIISFADVANCPAIMHKATASAKIIALQLEIEGSDREIIDKDGIRDFLDTLYYPLYFLDFESMQPAVPLYDGTKPYMQIPTQYSLHYIEREGAKLKHKEFLAESGPDPRRAIAEKLCEDIPYGACVTAFNKSFECARIKELAEAFPDLRDHLLDMNANMKDFLDPFRAGYYYKDAFGGSFSIKSVLPGLFPGDPELDYHALEGVHNGGEAKAIFPKIKDMSPEEREITRRNLLKYCELDTYAMVKIWQRLVEVSN